MMIFHEHRFIIEKQGESAEFPDFPVLDPLNRQTIIIRRRDHHLSL
jgi:hypothetical protein